MAASQSAQCCNQESDAAPWPQSSCSVLARKEAAGAARGCGAAECRPCRRRVSYAACAQRGVTRSGASHARPHTCHVHTACLYSVPSASRNARLCSALPACFEPLESRVKPTPFPHPPGSSHARSHAASAHAPCLPPAPPSPCSSPHAHAHAHEHTHMPTLTRAHALTPAWLAVRRLFALGSLSCTTSLVGHKDTVLAMDAATWGDGSSGSGGGGSAGSSWHSGRWLLLLLPPLSTPR